MHPTLTNKNSERIGYPTLFDNNSIEAFVEVFLSGNQHEEEGCRYDQHWGVTDNEHWNNKLYMV